MVVIKRVDCSNIIVNSQDPDEILRYLMYKRSNKIIIFIILTCM